MNSHQNGTEKVLQYLTKSSPVLPSRESQQITLSSKKLAVKGSRLDEWRRRGALGGNCNGCSRTVNRLTVDHIVPLLFLANLDNAFELAVNDDDNFQFLCEICNRKKSGQLDMLNQKTAPLLAKYIAPYLIK